MAQYERLRPLERRILRLDAAGVDEAEIARRFHRSADFVRRVRELAELPTRDGGRAPDGNRLRPLERRVLRWRDLGVDHEEIATRFRRHPRSVAQIEQLARYKLSNA
jgi:hypothetical protein